MAYSAEFLRSLNEPLQLPAVRHRLPRFKDCPDCESYGRQPARIRRASTRCNRCAGRHTWLTYVRDSLGLGGAPWETEDHQAGAGADVASDQGLAPPVDQA